MKHSIHLASLHVVALCAVVPLAGCRVSPSSAAEQKTMTFIKHRITIRNRSAKNPTLPNPENIAAGKEAFETYCVACHGMDGQNTGVPFAEKLSPPLPLLTSPDVQSYTDGQLKWVIDNGIAPSGMPASRGILNDDEIWSIVLYLRHLPPAGSLGEPKLYSH